MIKLLVLTALPMFLAGRALASWAWVGLGPMEQGEASLLGERGCRLGVGGDHRWHFISCNRSKIVFYFISLSTIIWLLQIAISLNLKMHTLGSQPPIASGLPSFEAGLRHLP